MMMNEDDDSDKRLRRNTWRTDLCRNTASPVGTLVQSPPCCRYAVTPPRSFDDPSPRLAPCPSNVAAHPDMSPCQATPILVELGKDSSNEDFSLARAPAI